MMTDPTSHPQCDATGASGMAAADPASQASSLLARIHATHFASPSSAADAWHARWCNAETLARYMLVHGGEAAKAEAAIAASLKWRRSAILHPLRCTMCDDDAAAEAATASSSAPGAPSSHPLNHCFLPLGLDDAARPIVYGSQARARDLSSDTLISHLVHTLEACFRSTPAQQWVWVLDFHDFGWRHALNVRMALSAVSLFYSHMPEQLGALYLINTPPLFTAFFSAILPLLDGRTRDKIVHVPLHGLEAALVSHGLPGWAAAWTAAAAEMEARPGNVPPLPAGAGALSISAVAALVPPPVSLRVDAAGS